MLMGMVGRSCVALAAAAFLWGAAPAPADEPGHHVRLTVGDDSTLAIGALPPFEYDGRDGAGYATVTDRGDGRLGIHMEAGDITIPPMKLFPALPFVPLAIEIVPRVVDGEIDTCSGAARLEFDATFRPNFAPSLGIEVKTTLGTATTTFGGHTVEGVPMDHLGNLRLAGIAAVARTGNPLTDALLRLPAPAVADLEVHVDLDPTDVGSCPTSPEPPRVTQMAVMPGSRLLISTFAPFDYDGKGSGGSGSYTLLGGGRYSVEFAGSDLRVPPVRFLPGVDAIRVDILTAGIGGTVDVCTGAVDLAFDAAFQPVVGTLRPSSVSVVTDLTTATSSGYFQSFTGDPMDRWGDVHLVGVAKVPRTGDLLVDLLLSLPTDAVADLRVHLDLPPCPA